jgi:hypothetical protein
MYFGGQSLLNLAFLLHVKSDRNGTRQKSLLPPPPPPLAFCVKGAEHHRKNKIRLGLNYYLASTSPHGVHSHLLRVKRTLYYLGMVWYDLVYPILHR